LDLEIIKMNKAIVSPRKITRSITRVLKSLNPNLKV
jgi:hypothetical protein